MWPDVTVGVRDRSGNPCCYLMNGYVHLATVNEVWENNWKPLDEKKQKSVPILDKSSAKSFFNRLNGRTLDEELKLAGIQNLENVKTWNGYPVKKSAGYDHFCGLTFEYQRWGNSGVANYAHGSIVDGAENYFWNNDEKDYKYNYHLPITTLRVVG